MTVPIEPAKGTCVACTCALDAVRATVNEPDAKLQEQRCPS